MAYSIDEKHKRPSPDYGSIGFVIGKIFEGWGKLRRFYLSHFRSCYVRMMKEKRRGSCRQCASCCEVMFKCPYIEGNVCKIYKDRFKQCVDFPIDERDLIFRKKTCGYSFEKK